MLPPEIDQLFADESEMRYAIRRYCIGCIAHLTTPRFPEALRPLLAKTAHRAYVAAFALALLTALLGVAVAVHRTF